MSNNKEIKGNLARLLATENLVVEHRQTPTAYFNVDTRVLTLPNWDKASDIVYDMLVGHEVGHALFTPNRDWRDTVDCPKDFVNVIEDARIEKLMKRKYPGLKKSFVGGYKELNDRDFFNIHGEDLEDLSLIDRINLHFKIGANALIPFSIEEKVFVARTDIAETFEEVLQIAIDVHEFSNKSEQVSETPVGSPEQSDEGEDQDEEDQVESEEGQEEDSEDKDELDLPNFGGAGSSSKADFNPDDYEEEEDEDGGSEGGDTSETQRSFNEKAENLSSRNYGGRSTTYIEIPEKVDLDNHLVDWTVLHDWIDSQASDIEGVYDTVDIEYQEFRQSSQKEVNYLVKEFECRKSADAYARAGQSKTGVLDTTKLHTYKYNEDIFKKVTVVPDGKNHGLIFILDWSGSMQNELLATVKQLLNLTSFCKKVQIPFEVYAFTNEWFAAKRAIENTAGNTSDDDYYDYYGRTWDGLEKNEFYIDGKHFHLMNFVSSRSNGKDYERMCRNLFREANYYKNYGRYQNTIGVGLSGTPLNEAIVMLNYILPEFKKQNDLQKVNVCILTDGEACQSAYGREQYNDYKDENVVRPSRIDWGNCLRDRKTGRVYPEFEYDSVTNIFIQQVRDRNPNVNVIGFRILQGSQLSSFVQRYGSFESYSDIQKQWKKEKSAIIPNPAAFTALYAINNNALNQSTELDVEVGAKKGDISRAFKKMLKNKSTNKKLLNSFVEYVS
tara:strand:+ start:3849 stop:6023 length:2175 start_codon:yes stop_codon:yes gene_type:complete